MFNKYLCGLLIAINLFLSPGAAQANEGTAFDLNKVKVVLDAVEDWLQETFASVTEQFTYTAATSGGGVVADFGVVEFFPNLKSKIGFSANAKDAVLSEAVEPYLADIGPGIMCSNIEFDMWYRHPGEPNAAIVEETDATLTTTRQVALVDSPSPWLQGYEAQLGNQEVSMLYQLTGAPAQYQYDINDTGKNIGVHPPPTNFKASAEVIGRWTAAANHSYPVLWSFWNEPIHTFMAITRHKDYLGREVYPNETVAEFQVRESAIRSSSTKAFAKLYSLYNTQLRKKAYPYSQLGMASFLSADFSAYRLTTEGKIYFHALTDELKTRLGNPPIDFVTFNNFNGKWPVSISGARTVLGNRSDVGPFIVTQYSPSSLKVSDVGSTVSDTSSMHVAVEMLNDLAQLERAADVRHLCMSYWVGGKYGFLSEVSGGGFETNPRYDVIKLFAELPIVRAKLSFGSTGLEQNGVHGLAGFNQAKASVLLWNESNVDAQVPLTLERIPKQISATTTTKVVKVISEARTRITESAYVDGQVVTVPANGVVLVEVRSQTIPDPLLRRDALTSSEGVKPTRFLQTKSFIDRTTSSCTESTTLPNFTNCSKNTGTYGFFDSVRSVAYLGRGEGTTAARVTATYESLPTKVFVNTSVHRLSESIVGTAPAAVTVSVVLPTCSQTITATTVSGKQYQVLDLSAVPLNCRSGKAATITFTLPGNVPTGTQAEIYVSRDESEATTLAQHTKSQIVRSSAIDTKERLEVAPAKGGTTVVNDAIRIVVVRPCADGTTSCAPVPLVGTFALVNEDGESVITFTSKDGGAPVTVRAPRGKYTVQYAGSPYTACVPIVGEVEISKGITPDVTVACAVQ